MTAEPAGAAEVAPLAGFTVAVTAVRRADELGTMLERRGATVVHAPALRLVPLADDGHLFAATRGLLTEPPDVVVATTGIGFRGWLEAAEAWGLGAGLLDRLRAATVFTRGPKATGAVRAAGLVEEFSPPSESSAGLLEHMLAAGVAGRRIAVQWHGEPPRGFLEALRAAGATVVDLPVYRWLPPTDLSPLDTLLDALLAGGIDALTFTSAAAVSNLLARASSRNQHDALLARLRTDPPVVGCVGPVTAAELERLGVATVQPERFRLGALVRALTDALQAGCLRLSVARQRLELRGHAALVNGSLRPVPPTGMALLREMARRPGVVVARADLLRALPGQTGDEHAVEMAVARLRAALGEPRLIETVVKRGYRLNTNPRAPVMPTIH
jgi:uroporphyrinogen-III synthase